MTKDEEIALLDKTIKAFGADSYLGPWLAANRGRLVADIRNDVTPSALTPSDLRAETERALQAARKDAEKIKADARDWAAGFKTAVEQEMREKRAAAFTYTRGTIEQAFEEALARLRG